MFEQKNTLIIYYKLNAREKYSRYLWQPSNVSTLSCLFVFGSHFRFYVFANATSGIYGDFYNVNVGHNSNDCKIKGLQEIMNVYFSILQKNVSFIDILSH